MDFSELEPFVPSVKLEQLIKPQPDLASQFVETMKSTTHQQPSVNAELVSTSSKEDAVPAQPEMFMKPQFKTVSQSAELTKSTLSEREDAFAARAFT